MKEHPILMQGPLVRATLEGRKTQTRRLLRNQPPSRYHLVRVCGPWAEFENDGPTPAKYSTKSPLGEAGDRLWVRETFAIVHGCRDMDTGYIDDWMVPRDLPKDDDHGFWTVLYRADDRFDESKEDRGFSWRPMIHMPRWACRLVLPLVSVRVERVQDITEEDAKAEGVERISAGPGWECWMGYGPSPSCKTARDSFRSLWISIYGEASWDANPWVWVAEWKEIEVRK